MASSEVVVEVPPPRLRWYKEFAIVLVFYAVYSYARNQFGSARVELGDPPTEAFDNALHVIRIERFFGLFVEPHVQSAFLGWHWFIRFWNVYYGTFHFVVTIAVFVWLFLRAPARFARWRNTLACMTLAALIGFSLFPLMPPRLLDKPQAEYGGLELAEERGIPPFGFVDTLAQYGGLWSFDSGTMKEISNQYAAMPSLHTGWSMWCALAMWPLVRRKWLRALLVLYPMATVFCIMVTGNHYWLDALGGIVVLAVGLAVGTLLDQWNQRRIVAKARAQATAKASQGALVDQETA